MNISYGRLADDSFAWFETATPGGENTGRYSFDIEEVTPDYPADLVISEYCASNDYTVPNAEGKCCGFVSVRNISQREIRLMDYCLSDSEDNISKWRFPQEVSLAPGTSSKIICSGLDKVDSDGNIHTSFKLNSKDSVILLSVGGEVLQRFSLGKRYEGVYAVADGISANVRYARINDSTRRLFDTPEQASGISNLRVVINEVSAIKGNGAEKEYDWVELYNPTTQDISLEGWKLHDNDSDSVPYVFGDVTLSAGGYKLVYCSKKSDAASKSVCASFSLSSSGETLTLYNSGGGLEDLLVYGKLRKGVTAGRAREGTADTVYFSTPTPGKENAERCYSGYVEMPSLDTNGGFVDVNTTVRLKNCPDGAVCRYTTDGSVPNDKSPVFTDFTVTENTVLRLCAFESGKIRSDVVTSTFLTESRTQHSIPVVCLTSEPGGLFSSARGILAYGKNYKNEYPFFGANFWQDWEREANFEYYIDGVKALDVSAGIKVFGQYSRGNSQKSLSVFFRNDYGASSVSFPFFKDCDRKVFTSVVLRAGGQDQFFTRIRDAFTSQVMKGYTSLLYQEWQYGPLSQRLRMR